MCVVAVLELSLYHFIEKDTIILHQMTQGGICPFLKFWEQWAMLKWEVPFANAKVMQSFAMESPLKVGLMDHVIAYLTVLFYFSIKA